MRIYTIHHIFLSFLVAVTCPSLAEEPAESLEELQAQIEQVLDETHVPGVSIAIVHRDGPEWVVGLGQADLMHDRPATKDTLFRIGSVSKTFVSLSCLKLVEEGRVSLQDPLHELAPEVWFKNRWESTNPVRVVNLLEHTTGWDDIHFREYAEESPTITLLEAFEYGKASRICRWPPSTRMAYCNAGPSVAAYVVEKITGMQFEEYVEQNFFTPIGMTTATYFQPDPTLAATTYQMDGKTAYHYSNIIHRPSGAINASAKDMANYLLFYLNRGMQILSPASIDRMESPTSTWAAQEGLRAGYGLSNYWSIRDGFVYHGHNGAIDGGLSELAYMPHSGVGYFCSINASHSAAFARISKLIRSYITRDLPQPAVPLSASLPDNAMNYAGWYEPDSPSSQLNFFFDRILGLSRIWLEDDSLRISSHHEKNANFSPVTGEQFRYVSKTDPPEPVATAILLSPNSEGRFIQVNTGMTTLKWIPTWFAYTEAGLAIFVLVSGASILLYAPFGWRHFTERMIRLWPLIAVISILVAPVLMTLSGELVVYRMGKLTLWSLSVWIATIAFALATLASVWALWRARQKSGVRRGVYVHSAIVTTALVLLMLYLGYWGLIGLRLWL